MYESLADVVTEGLYFSYHWSVVVVIVTTILVYNVRDALFRPKTLGWYSFCETGYVVPVCLCLLLVDALYLSIQLCSYFSSGGATDTDAPLTFMLSVVALSAGVLVGVISHRYVRHRQYII